VTAGYCQFEEPEMMKTTSMMKMWPASAELTVAVATAAEAGSASATTSTCNTQTNVHVKQSRAGTN